MTRAEIIERARACIGQRFQPYKRGPLETDCVGVLMQVYDIGDYLPPVYSQPPARELFESELPRFFDEIGWEMREPGDVVVLRERQSEARRRQGREAEPRHCDIFDRNKYREVLIGVSPIEGAGYVVEAVLTDELAARVWRTYRFKGLDEAEQARQAQ